MSGITRPIGRLTNEIEEMGNRLIREFLGETNKPNIIDIEKFIIERLGYHVIYESFSGNDMTALGFTSDGAHGVDVVRDSVVQNVVFPEKCIVIDRYLLQPGMETKRRFTLAHEAGHVISHYMYGAPLGEYNNSITGEDDIGISKLASCYSFDEVRANKVAAVLLMPTYLIGQAFREFNNGKRLCIYGEEQLTVEDRNTIIKMAQYMNVSYSALFYRLKELSMFIQKDFSEYSAGIGGGA